MKEWQKLLLIVAIFLGAYYIPWDSALIGRAGLEAFMMLQEYARQHVLTCLIPAFFIAGAITVFVSQAAGLKYFGAKANKILSYSVASVSGSVLAVCSCTVLPLLLGGVLVAGFLLGRPGHPALIPEAYIQMLVGGNSLEANFFASVVGALMYFATLTEVPILQGLIGSGMGQGPALALLLAGPALSLPNMIAISSIIGIRKTAVYCFIVVVLSTIAGMAYGWFTG